MPVLEGADEKGSYMAWGLSGFRYYFNPASFLEKHDAYLSAQRQGIAIQSRIRAGIQSPVRDWGAYKRDGKGRL